MRKRITRNLRCVISGANGFVGSNLAVRLKSLDYDVCGIVRDTSRASPALRYSAELRRGDITESESLKESVPKADVLIHCAAWVSEFGSAKEIWNSNVTGTENLIREAHHKGIKRFIHVSSCSVYGSLQRHGIDETTSVRYTGRAYADSKIEAEKTVSALCQEFGIQYVIMRPSQVFGPGSPQFTQRPLELLKAGKLIVVDGGSSLFKPVYIDNLLDAFITLIEIDVGHGRTYNVTDGYTVTWQKLFSEYARIANVPYKPRSYPRHIAFAAGLVQSFLKKRPTWTHRTIASLTSNNSFSSDLLRKETGWQPKVGFEEAIEKIARALANQT